MSCGGGVVCVCRRARVEASSDAVRVVVAVVVALCGIVVASANVREERESASPHHMIVVSYSICAETLWRCSIAARRLCCVCARVCASLCV